MKPKPLPLAIPVPATRLPVSDESLRLLELQTLPDYVPDPLIQRFSEAGLRGWLFSEPPSQDPNDL